MKQVSKKRAAELRKRRKMLEEFVRTGRNLCEFPYFHDAKCGRPANDVHEILPRSAGGSVSDPDNCVPLCRQHHEYVERNPRESERIGLKRSRYESS